MSSLGSFTLVKNEIDWIGPHLEMWLPILDQMVFYDGGSTDGTLEVIRHVQEHHPDGDKLIVAEDKDPENLKEDYVRLFNECMWDLSTDYAFFLHPDMIPDGKTNYKIDPSAPALFTSIRSFAGDPGGRLYEILGRGEAWKNIYRLHRPNLGAHYHGHYGAQNEDVYFEAITGDEHNHYGMDFDKYPYPVKDSGIRVLHFSDVRHYERRLGRMMSCLLNQGHDKGQAEKIAPNHPRVSLKDGMGFTFKESYFPKEFIRLKQLYAKFQREVARA